MDLKTKTKVLCVSDLHGFLPVLPDADIFLIAGDISPCRSHHSPVEQKIWFENAFCPYLKLLPYKHIVFVAGNHDFFLQQSPKSFIKDHLPENCHYIEDELIELNGIKIYGTPWSLTFCDWAFMCSEVSMKEKFENIPNDVDILLTHGAPRIGKVDYIPWQEAYTGSVELAMAIKTRNIKYCISGHIHEAEHKLTKIHKCKYACVSLLDDAYDIAYQPLIIKI